MKIREHVRGDVPLMIGLRVLEAGEQSREVFLLDAFPDQDLHLATRRRVLEDMRPCNTKLPQHLHVGVVPRTGRGFLRELTPPGDVRNRIH